MERSIEKMEDGKFRIREAQEVILDRARLEQAKKDMEAAVEKNEKDIASMKEEIARLAKALE